MKAEFNGELRACAEYADRLVDLSDGELAGQERQLVEGHVTQCTGCQAELTRLDASLAILRRTGFQPVQPSGMRNTGLRPVVYYSAALSLGVLVAAGFAAISFFAKQDAPQTAQVTPQTNPPRSATIPPADEAAALHQIALIEQQARIQASLDLLPKDPWFAEQREANEELLARFKAAVSLGEAFSRDESAESDGDLDEGESL